MLTGPSEQSLLLAGRCEQRWYFALVKCGRSATGQVSTVGWPRSLGTVAHGSRAQLAHSGSLEASAEQHSPAQVSGHLARGARGHACKAPAREARPRAKRALSPGSAVTTDRKQTSKNKEIGLRQKDLTLSDDNEALASLSRAAKN